MKSNKKKAATALGLGIACTVMYQLTADYVSGKIADYASYCIASSVKTDYESKLEQLLKPYK